MAGGSIKRISFDLLDDLFFVFDGEGEVHEWNRTAVETTGYADPDLASMSLADLLDPEDADRMLSAVTDVSGSGETRVEVTLVTADGDRIPYEFRASRFTDDSGDDRFVGIGRDVTGRKERAATLEALNQVATSLQEEETVEAACRRTVETAATLLDFEMCSVLVREGDWLVPYAMSADAPPDGSRRMRIDQGLAGKTYRTGETYVVDDVETDETSDPAKETYRSGLSVPIGDHGVFQAVETAPGAFDENDSKLAELLVAHTATAIDRIERERELERKNDRLEEFAGVVSHDLRNPLNVAQLRLELAREECASDHLDEVASAHDRMADLIEDILAVARQGEAVSDVEPVALADIVDRCWGNVDTADADLVVDTDLTIRADEGRLRQLLENLIRNAVEHGGEDVTVGVGTTEGGFYVEDDGPGIPPEDRGSVFDVGYSTSEDGTGFGLSIVERIAEAHGWEVGVTEGSGGGARFEFTGVTVVD